MIHQITSQCNKPILHYIDIINAKQGVYLWAELDLNQRRLSQRSYNPPHLTALASTLYIVVHKCSRKDHKKQQQPLRTHSRLHLGIVGLEPT